MVIGIDFDNTIVSYDSLFKKLALERGLVEPGFAANKTLIRDHLRSVGKERLWTALQGEAYGPRMAEAVAFPGVKSAIARLIRAGVSVRIISHKTRFPIVGEPFDLHGAARGWLEKEGFWSPAVGMLAEHAFFELTKEAKLCRISSETCIAFIDDLPEILTSPLFPPSIRRFLFDPERTHSAPPGLEVLSDWGLFEWK
jgi:hypothetical protein